MDNVNSMCWVIRVEQDFNMAQTKLVVYAVLGVSRVEMPHGFTTTPNRRINILNNLHPCRDSNPRSIRRTQPGYSHENID